MWSPSPTEKMAVKKSQPFFRLISLISRQPQSILQLPCIRFLQSAIFPIHYIVCFGKCNWQSKWCYIHLLIRYEFHFLFFHTFHIYPYMNILQFYCQTKSRQPLAQHKRNMFLHIHCAFFSLVSIYLLICFLHFLSFRNKQQKRILLHCCLSRSLLLYRIRRLQSPTVRALKR